MKILILTFGSTGDVLPYIALGDGLTEKGHEVVICTNSRFENLVVKHGMRYAYMSDDITQLIESEFGRRMIEGLNGAVGFLRAMCSMIGKIGDIQTRIINDSWMAVKTNEPDVIVFSPKSFQARHFAEKIGCKAIAAPLFPQHVPTATRPSLGFPRLGSFNGYNLYTYKIVRGISQLIAGSYIKKWRINHDLSPAFSGIDICHDTAGNRIPVINGYSKALITPPKDYPENVHTCGFWFLQQAPGWVPPTDLVEFLAQGPAPVYFGFGSMASVRSKRITAIIVEAVTRCGCRAILATGWGGLSPERLPNNIFQISSAPHDWLFPRVSAVVHHGGAGTTAAGLKAGRPTLICPIFADQPLWGEIVFQLGAGVAPISQNKLNVLKLSLAINALLHDHRIKMKALEIAEQLNGEDGIGNAISVIESVMAYTDCEQKWMVENYSSN